MVELCSNCRLRSTSRCDGRTDRNRWRRIFIYFYFSARK